MDGGNWLVEADRAVFYLINKKLSSPALDNLMLILRQAFTWIPVYFFFLLFFFANCRKYILPIVVLTMLTFAISDFTSASILKPLLGRLRPCRDPEFNFTINNIAGCGGIFSMPSSHASNHFGLATFWFLIIRHTLARKWTWLFVWAIAICYSQIYVGVHYPGDILGGALLGSATGYLCYYLFLKWIAMPTKELKTTA